MTPETVTLHIVCPHSHLDGVECETEFEVEADVEPSDPSYGADADGNRGMYIPAYVIEPDNVYCPSCGGDCTKQAQQAAENYEFPAWPDEPDYEPEDFDQ